MDLTLQEVLIIGNNNDQVKFSELTLDMFRILQTLEREPQEDASYQAYSLPSRAPSMVITTHVHLESVLVDHILQKWIYDCYRITTIVH